MTVMENADLLPLDQTYTKHCPSTNTASFLEEMLGIGFAEVPNKGVYHSSEQASNSTVTGCIVKSIINGDPSADHSGLPTSSKPCAPFASAAPGRLPFPDHAMDSGNTKRKNSASFENKNFQADASLSEHRRDTKASKQEVFVRYTEKEKLQRKYECKLCKKRFVRPSSLTSHGYTHTGERPFACDHPGCTKRFSVLSNLRRHAIVHTRRRKNLTKEKQAKRGSLLQPFTAIGANTSGYIEQFSVGNDHVRGFNSAYESQLLLGASKGRTLPYYPMTSPFFASDKQGARETQGTQDIHKICNANAFGAATENRLLPQQQTSVFQTSSASGFGSNLQGTDSNALFMNKLPTPASTNSCNSSPGSKWTAPLQLSICLDASSRTFSSLGNICTTSTVPFPSIPCPSLSLSSALPDVHTNVDISNQLTGYQQTSLCDGSISNPFNDASSSNSSSQCSSFNDSSASIHATLSDILGPARVASRPAMITGSSVTTKAMNSAIELLSEPRSTKELSLNSPLPLFSSCYSGQSMAQKLSLQQGPSSSASNNSAAPLLPPLSSVQSCLGQIGGMATAAPMADTTTEGFSIDSWLDDMEKRVGTGNAAAATVLREEPQMNDSVWQLLQACSNSDSYGNGSYGNGSNGNISSISH
ncbi:hypothetical protein LPJ64_000109 [Coemansia asiatica]|uniref:C2H2-type domain-containing protein n=1 Tax=Coemansia asiatica TaxID=1052880 RepID=A0A9W8CND9_9FUNG|nr:hypothetical protein LPJ64_000109 [Coemansia asiatica]